MNGNSLFERCKEGKPRPFFDRLPASCANSVAEKKCDSEDTESIRGKQWVGVGALRNQTMVDGLSSLFTGGWMLIVRRGKDTSAKQVGFYSCRCRNIYLSLSLSLTCK